MTVHSPLSIDSVWYTSKPTIHVFNFSLCQVQHMWLQHTQQISPNFAAWSPMAPIMSTMPLQQHRTSRDSMGFPHIRKEIPGDCCKQLVFTYQMGCEPIPSFPDMKLGVDICFLGWFTPNCSHLSLVDTGYIDDTHQHQMWVMANWSNFRNSSLRAFFSRLLCPWPQSSSKLTLLWKMDHLGHALPSEKSVDCLLPYLMKPKGFQEMYHEFL